jgi:hypothetical protein
VGTGQPHSRGQFCRGALGLAAAGLASAVYQRYATGLDRRSYPPPGDLVDMGGRKLHLLKTPGTGPTLVIIAALGAPALDWLAIQRALAPEMPGDPVERVADGLPRMGHAWCSAGGGY